MAAKLRKQKQQDLPHKKSKLSSKASTQSSWRSVSRKCEPLLKRRYQESSQLDALQCHIRSLALNSKVLMMITKLLLLVLLMAL